jgi:hypothetical protein
MGRNLTASASSHLGRLVVIGPIFASGLTAMSPGFLDLGAGPVREVAGVVGFALLFSYFRIEFWTAFLVDFIAAELAGLRCGHGFVFAVVLVGHTYPFVYQLTVAGTWKGGLGANYKLSG